MSVSVLTKIWCEVMGGVRANAETRGAMQRSVAVALNLALDERNTLFTFAQVEVVLLQGLVDKGSLVVLTDW